MATLTKISLSYYVTIASMLLGNVTVKSMELSTVNCKITTKTYERFSNDKLLKHKEISRKIYTQISNTLNESLCQLQRVLLENEKNKTISQEIYQQTCDELPKLSYEIKDVLFKNEKLKMIPKRQFSSRLNTIHNMLYNNKKLNMIFNTPGVSRLIYKLYSKLVPNVEQSVIRKKYIIIEGEAILRNIYSQNALTDYTLF